MSITEDYVKCAEECERLAGACIAESNRNILLYSAAGWRTMAEDAAAGAFSAASAKSMQGSNRRPYAGSGQGERGEAAAK
jgi:hypothetical protein